MQWLKRRQFSEKNDTTLMFLTLFLSKLHNINHILTKTIHRTVRQIEKQPTIRSLFNQSSPKLAHLWGLWPKNYTIQNFDRKKFFWAKIRVFLANDKGHLLKKSFLNSIQILLWLKRLQISGKNELLLMFLSLFLRMLWLFEYCKNVCKKSHFRIQLKFCNDWKEDNFLRRMIPHWCFWHYF